MLIKAVQVLSCFYNFHVQLQNQCFGQLTARERQTACSIRDMKHGLSTLSLMRSLWRSCFTASVSFSLAATSASMREPHSMVSSRSQACTFWEYAEPACRALPPSTRESETNRCKPTARLAAGCQLREARRVGEDVIRLCAGPQLVHASVMPHAYGLSCVLV